MPLTSRTELIDYCLRRLGAPVIEINVDDDQVEDRIDDAIQFWQEYHFDGIQRTYLKAELTATTITLETPDTGLFRPLEVIEGQTSGAKAQVHGMVDETTMNLFHVEGEFVPGEDIIGETTGAAATILDDPTGVVLGNYDNQYFELSDAITGVVRVLMTGVGTGGTSTRNMFNLHYQFRLSDMYNLISTDLIYYAQVKQHLSMLDLLFPGERGLNFNRKQGRLYVETNWYETFRPGDTILVECYRILDPAEFPRVWDDLFLKMYATALIKRQWGANMSKFSGIQLPGGVTLNGVELFQQAQSEINNIETEMQLRFQEPPQPMFG